MRTIDQQTSQQIRVLSLISILLVVMIHSYNQGLTASGKIIQLPANSIVLWIENFISDGIARSAVPIFFLISGFFFWQKKPSSFKLYTQQWRKKTNTILVPFLIWSFFGLAFFTILQIVPFTKSFFNSNPILTLSAEEILTRWLLEPVNYQLWFLQVLFLVILLSPILGISIVRYPIFATIILLTLWYFKGGYYGWNQYFFEGFCFFGLGGIAALSQYNMRIKQPPLHLSISIWFLLITAKHFSLLPPSFLNPINKISILAGLIPLWQISRLLTHVKVVQQLTPFSFWIYLTHEPVLTIVKKTLLYLLPIQSVSFILIYIASPLIVVFFIILLGKIMKNTMNQTFRILTGGR